MDGPNSSSHASPAGGPRPASRSNAGDVTRLLLDWSSGHVEAFEELIPLVNAELRRMAARSMSRERVDHTLQPTALVNELFLKLLGQRRICWQNRAHFFGAAAKIMRRLLVDHARLRRALKRGEKPLPLDEARDVADEQDRELIALDEALRELALANERQSKVVELRFFAGLGREEIAEILGVSATTVKRDWLAARLWLFKQVHPDGSIEAGRSEEREAQNVNAVHSQSLSVSLE